MAFRGRIKESDFNQWVAEMNRHPALQSNWPFGVHHEYDYYVVDSRNGARRLFCGTKKECATYIKGILDTLQMMV